MNDTQCNMAGKANKETESSQILNKFENLVQGFENTINDLEDKLVSISNSRTPDETSKDSCVLQARPPLFAELHELASRLNRQLSIFRDISSRINL